MADRKYTEDSNRNIRRNRTVIESLAAKNEMLKTELARERRAAKMAAGLTSTDALGALQEEGDKFTRKIEAERQRVVDLEESVLRMNQAIYDARHKRAGGDKTAATAAVLKKQIRMMENKMDKGLIRYNESLANNKELRNEIEGERRQRVVFDAIYKKLERQLHEKKKELAATIEKSNEAYEARDKAQLEMEALKQRAEKEQADFEVEWHELGKLIEADRDMKDAMREQQSATGRYEGTTEKLGNLTMEEEADVKRNMAKGQWGMAKDKTQTHLTQEKVLAYEATFQDIKAKTDIEDMDQLVAKFVEAEDKNFSLFNFVNELNSEIERLEMVTAGVKAEIEKFKGQGMSTDNQRKKILHHLEQKLQRTATRAQENEAKFQSASKTINQLKTGIHSIFTRIGCASSSMEEMLGNQGVTESNMMQYLGIIEQRTTSILRTHKLNQAQAGLVTAGADTTSKALPTPVNHSITIQPPDWNDLSSGEDSEGEDDERPLTRDELTQKTLRGLSKSRDKKKMR
jgi:chromosome segregation ATPase